MTTPNNSGGLKEDLKRSDTSYSYIPEKKDGIHDINNRSNNSENSIGKNADNIDTNNRNNCGKNNQDNIKNNKNNDDINTKNNQENKNKNNVDSRSKASSPTPTTTNTTPRGNTNRTNTPTNTYRSNSCTTTSGNTTSSTKTDPTTKNNNRNDKNINVDQVRMCQNIQRAKTYYEILGVPKNADDTTIKSAYKRMALKLHPDKCREPSSEEAFKKVATAFQTLSNPEKRQLYDRYGIESRVHMQQQQEQDEAVMTAEEMFQFFFGNSRRQVTRRQAHFNRPRDDRHENERRVSSFLQFVPIIFILLITIISNFSSSSQQRISHYAFIKSHEFPIQKLTKRSGVVYFVAMNFHHYYKEGSHKHSGLEDGVEVAYFTKKCEQEERDLMRRLKLESYYETGNVGMQERPNCAKLQNLRYTLAQQPKYYNMS